MPIRPNPALQRSAMYGSVNHQTPQPNLHTLVGLEQRFVANADLRSFRKLISTNPKVQLATCVRINGTLQIGRHYFQSRFIAISTIGTSRFKTPRHLCNPVRNPRHDLSGGSKATCPALNALSVIALRFYMSHLLIFEDEWLDVKYTLPLPLVRPLARLRAWSSIPSRSEGTSDFSGSSGVDSFISSSEGGPATLRSLSGMRCDTDSTNPPMPRG